MSPMLHRCRIRLKKGEERSLIKGNPCVRIRQVEAVDGQYSTGCEAGVYDYRGNCLGAGFANMNADTPVRLLRNDAGAADIRLLRHRLGEALAFRHRFYPPAESFRLAFAESDWLPGLVVDKYGPYLCLQITTLGMEMRSDALIRILEDLLTPEAIVLRNDLADREQEELPLFSRVVRGSLPRQVEVPVDGLSLVADLVGGQKTGMFLDQRENRREAALLSKGRNVLDACCYTGTFSVMAALAGAGSVLGLDNSGAALNLAEENARRHGVSDRCSFLRDDAFVFLRKYAAEDGVPFDLIFLDPPALIQSKQTLNRDISTYRRLNRLALECLAPGGVLVTASCSHHLSPRVFLEELGVALRASRKEARLYRFTGASPDHPVLPAMAETRYLKCAFLMLEGG